MGGILLTSAVGVVLGALVAGFGLVTTPAPLAANPEFLPAPNADEKDPKKKDEEALAAPIPGQGGPGYLAAERSGSRGNVSQMRAKRAQFLSAAGSIELSEGDLNSLVLDLMRGAAAPTVGMVDTAPLGLNFKVTEAGTLQIIADVRLTSSNETLYSVVVMDGYFSGSQFVANRVNVGHLPVPSLFGGPDIVMNQVFGHLAGLKDLPPLLEALDKVRSIEITPRTVTEDARGRKKAVEGRLTVNF